MSCTDELDKCTWSPFDQVVRRQAGKRTGKMPNKKVLLASFGSPGGMAPCHRGRAKGTNSPVGQWLGIALLVSALTGSGCAHFPFNVPLAANDAPRYRFCNSSSPTNS